MFRKWIHTAGYAVLLTIAALALMQAGPLDPIAPPGPTMKTLDEIPPTWSLLLPAAQRYVVVMSGAAVLDKETGLVWQRSPSAAGAGYPWHSANYLCARSSDTGGRRGWRLPTVAELSSLGADGIDSTTPFDFGCSGVSGDGCVVLGDFYWTSTTNPNDPTEAFGVRLENGFVSELPKDSGRRYMCVRGASDGVQ
jgi:Protein of unknown function (DUF1566)